MARFPYLPLWTDAWVADTLHLTRLERGTYHDLLVLMWRSPGCRVPNDDRWLCRKLSLTDTELDNELKPLIKEFCQGDGNWLSQKRLHQEWTKAKVFSDRQTARAKQRWQKEKPTSSGNADTAISRNAPIPIPIPIESKKDSCSLFDWPADFREEFWEVYPLKVGKKKALEALAKVSKVGIPWPKLMEGARVYAEHVRGKEPQYIKHPTTWLNGAHWEDALKSNGHGHPLSGVPLPEGTQTFVKEDTPQWTAWNEYLLRTTGKRPPCKNFGWWFPSEWPPGIINPGASVGETDQGLFQLKPVE